MKPHENFKTVTLSLNIAGLGNSADCNPGGSYICTAGTQGCDAGLTCAGTSSTDQFDPTIFESVLLIDSAELKQLSAELQQVVVRFANDRVS
ncbi:MAG: hypothetical protein JWP45_2168 [Mucilaginibacter sp.]|jgi:hypothetical protein|nr:hypothetical protein [Mucilaginibacter sp.]MDB5139797.1 hypothetical protein [Mucilaginibacter sp.]